MDKYKKKKKGLKKMKPKALDEATFNYYTNITNLFNKDEFESDDDKERFIHSILKQLSKEGLKVSKEGMISKLMEKLIVFANIKQFQALLKNFSSDWEAACCDRFSSFVTQTIVRNAAKFFVDISILKKECKEPMKEDELKQLQEDILKTISDGLIAFLFDQFALHMQHFSTSHIIRAVIEMLAGMRVDDAIICGKKEKFQEHKKNPTPINSVVSMKTEIKSMFDALFLRICTTIVSLPKLDDHVCNYLSNPVLQTFILCLKTLPTSQSSKFFNALIDSTKIFHKEDEDGIPALCTHEVASHFAEQALKSLPDEMFDKIYSEKFKGHLSKMASSPTGNFVLQRLITYTRNKEQFEAMYNEVHPHFESILAVNHIDVIVKISEACIVHSCKQLKFLKHISEAFHCREPESRRCKLAQLLLSLSTYDAFYKIDEVENDKKEDGESNSDDKEDEEGDDEDDSINGEDEETKEDDAAICLPQIKAINIYGSIIVQNLLNFSNTSAIVSSLFELTVDEWKLLCKDPCGCRVVEAFVGSKKVSEKSKDFLYAKLEGCYMELACSKWGSRSFDALWLNGKQKEKKNIIDELNKNPNKLKSDKFGFFIFQKCLAASQNKRKHNDNDKVQCKKTKVTK